MQSELLEIDYVAGMKTILVPVDFSSICLQTVETACALAKATNASLVFLHVVQENMFFDGIGVPVVPTQDETDAMVFEARRALNAYVATAVQSGVSATASVVYGFPVKQILVKASEVKPDLIVMGSHGHNTFHHLLVGSTTQGILKRAECPIVIVPARRSESAASEILSKTEQVS